MERGEDRGEGNAKQIGLLSPALSSISGGEGEDKTGAFLNSMAVGLAPVLWYLFLRCRLTTLKPALSPVQPLQRVFAGWPGWADGSAFGDLFRTDREASFQAGARRVWIRRQARAGFVVGRPNLAVWAGWFGAEARKDSFFVREGFDWAHDGSLFRFSKTARTLILAEKRSRA